MKPQVVGVTGNFAGQYFLIDVRGQIFGRDPSTCNIVFPENTQGISRNHCKLQFNPQTKMFVLNDLGSTYGTFLASGEKLEQGLPVALTKNQEFYLGSKANTFRVRV